jgi:hypothetical protein
VLTALIVARQVPGIARFRWETDQPSGEITDAGKTGGEVIVTVQSLVRGGGGSCSPFPCRVR